MNASQSNNLMADGTSIYSVPSFSTLPKRDISGIYGIINSSNRKLYVGSAKRMRHRWSCHRMSLNQNKHENIYLQRAFNKNPQAFEFNVIEEVSDHSNLLEREQFWMDFFKSYDYSVGYNIAPKARSCAGIKRRPEVIEAISKRLKGVKLSPERIAASVAGRSGKRRPPTIETRAKLSASKKGSKWKPEALALKNERRKILKWGYKPIIQITLEGREVRRFDSIQNAENFFGKRTNIHAVCKGQRNECLGFKWRYA